MCALSQPEANDTQRNKEANPVCTQAPEKAVFIVVIHRLIQSERASAGLREQELKPDQDTVVITWQVNE